MLLALALLVAQFGAEAHAYSHLKSDDPGLPGTMQGCGQCLSFAPVLGAAPVAECVPLAQRWEVELRVTAAEIAIPIGRHSFTFNARAPPRFL